MTPEQLESAIEDARSYLVLEYAPLASFDFRHLVSWALTGWHPAVVILQDMAHHLKSTGAPLPLWLQDYFIVACETRPSRKAGRNRLDDLVRNLTIALTIEATAEHYSLDPTRNAATETESACSIVTQALKRLKIDRMSEANVNAIWRRMGSWADEMRGEAARIEGWERAAFDRLLAAEGIEPHLVVWNFRPLATMRVNPRCCSLLRIRRLIASTVPCLLPYLFCKSSHICLNRAIANFW